MTEGLYETILQGFKEIGEYEDNKILFDDACELLDKANSSDYIKSGTVENHVNIPKCEYHRQTKDAIHGTMDFDESDGEWESFTQEIDVDFDTVVNLYGSDGDFYIEFEDTNLWDYSLNDQIENEEIGYVILTSEDISRDVEYLLDGKLQQSLLDIPSRYNVSGTAHLVYNINIAGYYDPNFGVEYDDTSMKVYIDWSDVNNPSYIDNLEIIVTD